MTLTSIGAVSNSASSSFSNAVGTIAYINYNRVIASEVPIIPIHFKKTCVLEKLSSVQSHNESKSKSKNHSKNHSKKNKKHNKKNNCGCR